MMQPKIGLTLDFQEKKTYSLYPWYALRKNYASSIHEMGALPLPLVPDIEFVEKYLSLIDGLLVTGGGFDVAPSLYGEDSEHTTVNLIPTRTDFEFFLIQKALEQNMPILGICGGEQILNVVLGGSLVQHIPDVYDSNIKHQQLNPRNETSHEVSIMSNTLLADIVKESTIFVNSAHHQSVNKPGQNVVKNAIAPDGVIEGIESKDYNFCLGVQWHPEFLITLADRSIMKAFVNACK